MRNLAWFAAWYQELDFLRPARLRVIPGPQWPLLTEVSREAMLAETFTAGTRSDRMGIRLQGPALALERPLEMLSSGVAPGTVQLPPDGAPILLMADRQTTGGYPRLGEVATVDLPRPPRASAPARRCASAHRPGGRPGPPPAPGGPPRQLAAYLAERRARCRSWHMAGTLT